MPLLGNGCAIASPAVAPNAAPASQRIASNFISALFFRLAFGFATARLPVRDLHQDIDGLTEWRGGDGGQCGLEGFKQFLLGAAPAQGARPIRVVAPHARR